MSKDYSFSETNTDIIVILMDVDRFANANHARNPEKHSFLNAGTLKESTSPRAFRESITISATRGAIRTSWRSI